MVGSEDWIREAELGGGGAERSKLLGRDSMGLRSERMQQGEGNEGLREDPQWQRLRTCEVT